MRCPPFEKGFPFSDARTRPQSESLVTDCSPTFGSELTEGIIFGAHPLQIQQQVPLVSSILLSPFGQDIRPWGKLFGDAFSKAFRDEDEIGRKNRLG